MLNSNQKVLLSHVISAAAKGNYCHGNGADWVITDETRTKVTCINHVRETMDTLDADASARYLASTPAHAELHTAENLLEFIS